MKEESFPKHLVHSAIIFTDIELNGNQKSILHVWVRRMDENGYAFPSMETHAKNSGVSERTTRRTFSLFEETRLFRRAERYELPAKRRPSSRVVVWQLNIDALMAQCNDPQTVQAWEEYVARARQETRLSGHHDRIDRMSSGHHDRITHPVSTHEPVDNSAPSGHLDRIDPPDPSDHWVIWGQQSGHSGHSHPVTVADESIKEPKSNYPPYPTAAAPSDPQPPSGQGGEEPPTDIETARAHRALAAWSLTRTARAELVPLLLARRREGHPWAFIDEQAEMPGFAVGNSLAFLKARFGKNWNYDPPRKHKPIPWCGQCESPEYRWFTFPDNSVAQCDVCHPKAVAERAVS